ncbi:MAG TPA: hypothetical protein PLJ98_01790 [Acholeplasmataceae bacterium]|jgi:hypothetical protein|nr:hypothetical protein [Acholeplasmataceae bacterium]HRX44935.1 hypothetical protein [Acholeplasmataceae bacterium]
MSKDQLKEERMKILDLLAKGIIKADEAEKLLAALESDKEVEVNAVPSFGTGKKAPFRMLKILIDSNDGDVVRIQIPVEFAKLLKTGKFNVNLQDADIDIDSLLQMINTGVMGEIVNVESADGDVVKIVVE